MFGRQAIGMVWDYCEADPFGGSVGSWNSLLECAMIPFETATCLDAGTVTVDQCCATAHPLPDDAAAALVTDPPYYDAVPYAYLSDFFYVWLRRTLGDSEPLAGLLRSSSVPKEAEIVVDRPHTLSQSNKDIAFYERQLTSAFDEGRRVVPPGGIGTIVFASKTTASWEAILNGVIDAGWVITGSWPIDTEMATRVAAQGQARLASSVHIICRPREAPDGSLREEIGDWRDVLAELPKRIHEWMPRLASEGVVGADAIFACLGPALEIFSRFSRVERASGEAVTLREYLEHVWAAVSNEALSMIFEDADAAGLEPDARLTAMWLWTLNAGVRDQGSGVSEEDQEDSEDEPANGKKASVGGYTLEFDAARKIAQGLGAHLEKMPSLVEIKGDKAQLLPAGQRARYLFGKGADTPESGRRGRKKKHKQLSLFEELDEAEATDGGGWGELKGAKLGETVLDRVHQSMILFGAARGEALKRFLVEDGAGKDARFWKLAQSLSALYPSGSDERRWVDGVLARKKGLGF